MRLTDDDRKRLAWACILAAEHERELAQGLAKLGTAQAAAKADEHAHEAEAYDRLAATLD